VLCRCLQDYRLQHKEMGQGPYGPGKTAAIPRIGHFRAPETNRNSYGYILSENIVVPDGNAAHGQGDGIRLKNGVASQESRINERPQRHLLTDEEIFSVDFS